MVEELKSGGDLMRVALTRRKVMKNYNSVKVNLFADKDYVYVVELENDKKIALVSDDAEYLLKVIKLIEKQREREERG